MNVVDSDYFFKQVINEDKMGKIYLTVKSNTLFMGQVFEKEILDKKSDENSNIKNTLFLNFRTKHENIIKYIDVKTSQKYYYTIMEYCNGGTLDENLNKYKIKYGKAISEKIIQYIIIKIINAMSYLQSLDVDNFDLSLKNIYLNYHTEEAKNNIDIIHSNIKLKLLKVQMIEFEYLYDGIKINPEIEKFNTEKRLKKDKANEISFYLFLNNLFNGNFIFSEINQNGINIFEIKISIHLSLEAISFLINILQVYYSKKRIEQKKFSELFNHPFLKNNVSYFRSFNKSNVVNFIKGEYLVINIKNIDVINSIINKQFYLQFNYGIK